jgi:hypothetical protein
MSAGFLLTGKADDDGGQRSQTAKRQDELLQILSCRDVRI